MHVDKAPITSMQASLPKGPDIAPGEKSPLVVVLTEPDGKTCTRRFSRRCTWWIPGAVR